MLELEPFHDVTEETGLALQINYKRIQFFFWGGHHAPVFGPDI